MKAPDRVHVHTRSWERNGRRVIECETCGFRHLDPVPEVGQIERFYKAAYHRDVKRFPYDDIDDAFVARKAGEADRNRRYRAIFEAVGGLLGAGADRSMLEVGCGNQLLAKHFVDRGWRARVLEPNRDAAAWLRRFGLDVVEAMIEEIPDDELRDFSFVNLQFVLEHVRDPLAVLRRAARTMRPGGVIRVCVPNDFSPGQMAWLELSGVEPPWISWPDHINYFDFDSLSRLLARAGFREEGRSTNFPLEFLLLSGIDYYRNEADRARVRPIVQAFESALTEGGDEQAVDRYYERLARMGFGRSAIVYARRD